MIMRTPQLPNIEKESTVANRDNKGSIVSGKDELTENESAGKEVAIQTNPHEIERNSGQLTLRKKFVPIKFSDYCIFANNVKEGEDEMDTADDADFTPKECVSKQIANRNDKQKRSRGRPRKYKDTTNVSTSKETDASKEETNVKRHPITKVSSGFKCGICGKIFTLRGNAKTHLITHTDDKPYWCDFTGCGKSMRTKESLRRHRLSHLGIKSFECSECNKKFSCNLSLQEHMNLHSGEKPLSCGICGTKFRQIAVLKRHLTTHSNNKPYACEVCGKKFSLMLYVRSHMKTHTGERPFACNLCNKCFAHASDLNRHKIIHSGQKPYECSMCPMRYSDPSSRRRHEREHENKPQYMCHLCKQQFPRAGQLRVHLVKEHTTTASTNDQHSVQFPVKIESFSQIHQDTSVESNRVLSLQPTLVQTVSSSETGNVLGQEVNTVQIVLDSSCVGQIDNCKEVVKTPLQSDMSSIQNNVQAVVMEIPKSTEELTGLPANGTYKLINAEDGKVYEIQVEKESQAHFQEFSNGMKINTSNIKMSDGLVAFIQDGDTVTVVEQAQTADQSHNNNNMDLVVQKTGGIEGIVGNDVSKVLEGENFEPDTPTPPVIDKEDEHSNTNIVSIEIEQQEHLNLVCDNNQGINNHLSSDMSQNDSGHKHGYKHERHDHDIRNIQNLTAEISSGVSSAVSSSFIENPDLNSQDYYNWLSSFSEECKHFTVPLSKEVFQKISHVQKTLSDFMAMPTGVITDKNNFKILMGITQDLSQITSNHLSFMYSSLNE